jgi:hypothetical protein
MNKPQAKKLIGLIQGFVESHDDLRALGLAGSWARGNPRPDSDLDLIIVAGNPDTWRRCQHWVGELAFAQAGLHYDDHSTATYGAASAHVKLNPEAALELTFVPKALASFDPIDPGTLHILADAFTIIVDKDHLLARLATAVARTT